MLNKFFGKRLLLLLILSFFLLSFSYASPVLAWNPFTFLIDTYNFYINPPTVSPLDAKAVSNKTSTAKKTVPSPVTVLKSQTANVSDSVILSTLERLLSRPDIQNKLRGAQGLPGTSTYTLPLSDGLPGQVLRTNGAGVLAWGYTSGGGSIGAASTSSVAANYVPYAGANNDVNLGTHNLTIDTNSLFVDATNHRLGAGTITPAYKLEVAGDFGVTTTGGGFKVLGDTDSPIILGGYSGNQITGADTEGSAILSGGNLMSAPPFNYDGPNVIENNEHSVIVGGKGNSMTSVGGPYGHGGSSFIGGGIGNIIEKGGIYSVIVGGDRNKLTSSYGQAPYLDFIGGGTGNTIDSGWNSKNVIVGGEDNTIYGHGSSTIAGGQDNTAWHYGFVGGGAQNTAGADGNNYSTVAGGRTNIASGYDATIPGGSDNTASGNYSFAAGRRAKATAQGDFVITDSTNADFTVSSTDVFGARFAGGYWLTGGNVGIGTTAVPADKLEVNGNIRLTAGSGGQIIFADGSIMTSAGLGSASALTNVSDAIISGDSDANGTGAIIFRTGSTEKMRMLNNGNIGIGTTAPTAALSFGSTGTSTINAFGALTINSATSNALTLDSGTTGAINFGTGSSAKTITIGNSTGATSVVLNSGTGAINIGTNAIAHTVTLGNSTGATSVVLNSGTGAINIGTNAIAHTVTLGNTTGASAVAINTGTGNFALNTNQLFVNQTSGNVGVGTITPTTKLDVAGTVNATGLTINGVPVATSSDTYWSAVMGGISFGSNVNVDGLYLGSSSTSGIKINASGNVGIGTLTPTTKLDVAGTVNATGLTINGVPVGTSSDSYWSAVTGGISYNAGNITVNTNGDSVLISSYKGANSYGKNIFIGGGGQSSIGSVGDTNLGSYNTANGYQALYSNTTGKENTANGYQALYSNTTGVGNTANGILSLFTNTTGSYNTASGFDSLFYNITGQANSVYGGMSMYMNTTGSLNAAYGNNSLQYNTTGSNNTASGYDSNLYNTTGSNNAAFGYGSLRRYTTGSNNTAIGVYALGAVASTGSNNVGLGYYAGAYETGSNAFYIDNQDRTNTAGDKAGALLYGTFNATPANQTLKINATTTIAQNLTVSGGEILGSGGTGIKINGSGNVGIGTTSPTTKLDVVGTVNATALTINGVPVATSSDTYWVPATGGITYGSNVGIGGVVTPTQALDVTGNINTTGLYLGDGGTSGIEINSSGSVGIGMEGLSGIFPNAKLTVTNGGSILTSTEAYGLVIATKVNSSHSGLTISASGDSDNITITGANVSASNIGDTGNPTAVIALDSRVGAYFKTITNLYGYKVRSALISATVTNNYGFYIDNPTKSSSTLTNNYGLYIVSQTAGTNNYAIYSAGGTNYFEGNLGLGTTTPLVKLHVYKGAAGGVITPSSLAGIVIENSDDVSLQLFSPTTKAGMIQFGSSINGAQGRINYQHSETATTDYMSFDVLGTERLRIDVDGKIGIGTTTPAQALDLGAASASLTFSDTTAFHQIITAGTTDLAIMPGGNVGIGTTTPTTKLDVAGTVNATGLTINGTPVATSSDTYWNAVAGGISYSAGNVGIGTITPAGLFDVNGKLTVLSGGNVGIGMAIPVNILDVNGGVVIGASYAGVNTAPTNGMLIQGNVGIGTTSASSALDVNGDIRIHAGSGGAIYFADGSSLNSANVGSADALSNASDAVITGDSDSSSAGDIIFKIGSSEKMRIANAGILTFSNGLLLGSQIGWGTGLGAIVHLLGPTDATFTINSYTSNTLAIDSGTTGAINIGTNANAKTITIGNGTGATSVVINAGTGALNVGTNAIARTVTIGNTTGATAVNINTGTGNFSLNSGKLYVNATSGNVGVGVTTPTNALSFGNTADRKLWVENTAAGTAGKSLTVASGGTVAGTADTAGGNLILQAGLGTGTGASTISFQTGTTLATGVTLQTMSEKMTILGSGNVGIGTTTPLTKLTVLDTVSSSPRGILSMQISDDTSGARVGFAKARGTTSSPAVVQTGDILGRLMFRGYDGSSYLEMGSIETGVSGTVAATRVPTYMAFSTATDAAPSVLMERMRISNAGYVGIGVANPAGVLHTAGGNFILGPADTSTAASIQLREGSTNGTEYIALKAPNSIDTSVTFTLPSGDGTAGQILQTNGGGVLSWTANAASGMANPMTATGDLVYASNTASPATPARLGIGSAGQCLVVSGGLPAWGACTNSAVAAGADTQIQYNNAGSFGASSNFIWNDTNKTLSVTGTNTGAKVSLALLNSSTGTAATNELRIGNSAAADTLTLSVNSNEFTGAGNYAYIYNRQNAPLILGTNNTARLTILAGGSVGIGTTSPAKTLDITGTLGVSGHATLEGVTSTGATGTGKFVFDTSPTLVTPVLGVATGTNLALTSTNTTQATTSSALTLNVNSLTTGTGFYVASSSLTSGKLLDLQVSGTAAAASQTALNILTAGANGTNAITTYGAQISNTHTNATSGTNIALYLNASGATTANYGLLVNSGLVGIGTTTPTGNLAVTQTVTATGALKGIVYTGAVNTNQTLNTEIPAVTITTAGRQWATSTTLTTQREVLITAPTYSFVGASTITNAATVAIAGAPIKSTNASITNTHGLLIQATAVSTATNSYGLTVNAQTGATNNYAAAFLGGYVGIGTASPTVPFEVKGTGTGANIAKFTDVNTTGCTLATGGTIACSSDVRLKKNIEDINYGLDTVMSLRPVLYNWNYEVDGSVKSLGFIAQEVESLIPKLVSTDEEGMKSLNTTGMIPVLTRAIQEMNLNLGSIAGTITPLSGSASESFVNAFFGNLYTKIAAWLADTGNGVQNMFANVFNAKEKICVDGECLTKDDIRALLLLAHPGTSGSNSSAGSESTTLEPVVTPPADTTPASPPAPLLTGEGGQGSGEVTSPEPTTIPGETPQDAVIPASEPVQVDTPAAQATPEAL